MLVDITNTMTERNKKKLINKYLNKVKKGGGCYILVRRHRIVGMISLVGWVKREITLYGKQAN